MRRRTLELSLEGMHCGKRDFRMLRLLVLPISQNLAVAITSKDRSIKAMSERAGVQHSQTA